MRCGGRAANHSASSAHERELIRQIGDNELTQAIIGNVKVSAAGMAQALGKARKQTKQGKGAGEDASA